MSETEPMTVHIPEAELSPASLSRTLVRGGFGAFAIALAAFLTLSRTVDASRALHAWLVGVLFFLTVGLGALFFVILQHLARAGWSTVLRRIAEHVAATVPYVALLLLPLVLAAWRGVGLIHPWAGPHETYHVLETKRAFLNVPFFTIRYVIYLSVWTFFSRFYRGHSLKQDKDHALFHNYQLQWVAAPGVAAFALSVTFFAFDFLMALDPAFFSTIFGVYVFAGAMMSFFSFLALFIMAIQGRGLLTSVVTREHFQDIGKFMFGFVFFWGYVAFSQFMLIWYGNIPEETVWYGRRMEGNWLIVSGLLLFLHLLLPFPGLLSRHVKRNRMALAFWACLLLIAHYIDLFWLAMPALHLGGQPMFGPVELLALIAAGGFFFGVFGLHLNAGSLVPVGDPRLGESLAFENA